jgi:hypothetical protein
LHRSRRVEDRRRNRPRVHRGITFLELH